MKTEKYRMSFSTGGLFLQESIVIVDLFHRLKDWGEVRNKVDTDNLLQARTVSSAKRTSNVMELLETIVNNNTEDDEIIVNLITVEDEFKAFQQVEHFEKIQNNMFRYKI